MAVLTLTQMHTRLLSKFGDRSDLDDTTMTEYLNQAQQELAQLGKWKDLRRTVDHTATYAGVPATDRLLLYSAISSFDPKAIRDIRIITSGKRRRLIKIQPGVFDRRFPNRLDSTGTPDHYTEWLEAFEWQPIPSQALEYRIRYWTWPTDLSADGDTSDFTRKDYLLIARAAALIALDKTMIEKSRGYQAQYNGLLKSAKANDIEEPDSQEAMAQPGVGDSLSGNNYWSDPFVQGTP